MHAHRFGCHMHITHHSRNSIAAAYHLLTRSHAAQIIIIYAKLNMLPLIPKHNSTSNAVNSVSKIQRGLIFFPSSPSDATEQAKLQSNLERTTNIGRTELLRPTYAKMTTSCLHIMRKNCAAKAHQSRNWAADKISIFASPAQYDPFYTY